MPPGFRFCTYRVQLAHQHHGAGLDTAPGRCTTGAGHDHPLLERGGGLQGQARTGPTGTPERWGNGAVLWLKQIRGGGGFVRLPTK
jgi:hypothetical protein